MCLRFGDPPHEGSFSSDLQLDVCGTTPPAINQQVNSLFLRKPACVQDIAASTAPNTWVVIKPVWHDRDVCLGNSGGC